MRKVLILDDRIERKKTHMSKTSITKLTDCKNNNYLKMMTGEGIDEGSLSKHFADCDLLAIHFSWMNDKKLTSIIDSYAKDNNKLLIVFSGGISQTFLTEDFRRLSINSALFYSDKLPDFIETFATKEIDLPLLHFLYGNYKNIPLLMKYRQLIWQGSQNDADDFNYNYESYLESSQKATPSETQNELSDIINKEIINLKTL